MVYVDLADDEAIVSYVRSMYPVWQEYCWKGQEIAAIPLSARSVWTMMYHRTIWEEEALGEIPATYDALFDCIADWYDRGILDEYPLFAETSSSFDRLLHRILTDYVSACLQADEPIVFQDESLLYLLQRLESLRTILNAHDAYNLIGDAILYPDGMLTNLVYVSDERAEVYEPLVLDLGNDCCVESVFLTMAVINPNSTHVELAKSYLFFLAQHSTAWAQCVLLEGAPNGIREAECETSLAEYQQLSESLDEAKRSGDAVAVFSLETKLNELNRMRLEEWVVTPRMASMLYQVQSHFAVLTDDGYGFLQDYCADIIQMFEAGMIDSRTLTVRLDQRMLMKQSEVE